MNKTLPKVAYFCMEYGLDTNFKIYSGGLGILAGDIIKAAKDLEVPMVAIGIKWKQGYVDQYIGQDGKPVDTYRVYEYDFLEDTGVKVPVEIRDRKVWLKVWKCEKFNNVPLYLLDADLDENADRLLTAQLYGWFAEERVAQEIILGVGGVRALRELGIDVDVYHFNDNHPVFAGLELIREKMEEGMSFNEALEKTREEIVFTTHTPVPAGNEVHPHRLLEYMGAYLNLDYWQMKRLGGDPFNMTVAALRMARIANGVAQLHKETANDMWSFVEGRPEIIGITNGVHNGTWQDERIRKAYENGEDLLKVHQEIKKELIEFVEKRTGVKLDADKLLIGFSRRAAPYKRSNLIFTDEKLIAPYLESGKIQIIFAGKAHPNDYTGKGIIADIIKYVKKYPNSVVFLENYDMEIGAMLTRGCDIWLNNPRRPQEASGTSGMKAAMNGVLNCSILDGWWPEACNHGVNGWQFGDGKGVDDFETLEELDAHDAKCLYEVLLNEVVPTYYENKTKWAEMMRESIKSTQEKFSAARMVKEYYDLMYIKK
ncbi:alpha-glucan family phosphorylase [Thermobrachium celere]|uniref:alpha-glucan family phosphorylase n=1 Tax=Thermobrachium celere TaxID=53422 RepID=UPI001941F878|nr:alpha-glucan family phosphorylase [Thermobrachium celere]GFR34962.1 alpha-1,4 glucan phosphorylase [Thermobrachium celere]